MIAFAFDAAALAVLTAKLAVIVQLIALAIEIIAAQAAASFTFGLSDVGALGATQATRLIVRELLERLKKEVEAITKAMEHATMDALKKIAKEQLEKIAKDQLKEHAKLFVQEKVVDAAKDKDREAAIGMAQNIGRQSIETYFDARSGIDLGEPADVAKSAASDYEDGLKNEVTGGEGSAFADYTDLNGHVDNAVNAATEGVTGAAGDRVQQGVDALAGHHGVQSAGSSSTQTAGNAQEWARNEFG